MALAFLSSGGVLDSADGGFHHHVDHLHVPAVEH
jgi:hypothetical protein